MTNMYMKMCSVYSHHGNKNSYHSEISIYLREKKGITKKTKANSCENVRKETFISGRYGYTLVPQPWKIICKFS